MGLDISKLANEFILSIFVIIDTLSYTYCEELEAMSQYVSWHHQILMLFSYNVTPHDTVFCGQVTFCMSTSAAVCQSVSVQLVTGRDVLDVCFLIVSDCGGNHHLS